MSQDIRYVFLILSISLQISVVTSFFQYGCSTRGCSPHGAFSLTTPLPAHAPSVRWNWTTPTSPGFRDRGCSSSFATVTCPTHSGYVNFQNPDGAVMWQTSDNVTSRPFLPLLDFFGNVVTSDPHSFKLLWWDGSTQAEVTLDNFQPQFGAMMANDSVVVVTSTNTSTDQLLTYNSGGVVFASTHLSGNVTGFHVSVHGTFVPCGHPVAHEMRVYLVTCFVADHPWSPSARSVSGARRLFAIDLSGSSAPNSVAWHHDLPMPRQQQGFLMSQPVDHAHSGHAHFSVIFHNRTVYINKAGTPPPQGGQASNATTDPSDWSTLTAVRDLGHSASLVFDVITHPGQMTMYDVTQSWDNTTATGLRPLWVVSDNQLTAHHPGSGHVLARLDVGQLAPGLGQITSHVMSTRRAGQPDRDQLVFATQDSRGRASLVAVEAGLPPAQPRLLWSREIGADVTSSWRVGGQVASVQVTADGGWEFGLALSAVETRGDSCHQHVMAVF